MENNDNIPKTDTGVPLVDLNGSNNSNKEEKDTLQSFGFSSPSLGSIKDTVQITAEGTESKTPGD